ncbi:MAG: histidine kinase [Flavisolibacter sp.]
MSGTLVWTQTPFFILTALFFAGAGWLTYRLVQHRRMTIATRKMIEYFALSGYEEYSVDAILWDIARNCISRLNFEDCVIYLVDEERNMLVQKAAYGPKSPKGFEIANPIEIPLGQGIVGWVAQCARPTIISDTSKDSRYIIDDERRFSEMTVPIIHEGKVIGVIDSEHREKKFYTKQQLKAVQAIASLSSAKISRAMALESVKKSKAELLELNVKMAESKFLNLRLQMNPHFLFNALSSIQHLIVSQQTTRAYKYLTVFSNFLRSLLHYAEENFIPLDREVNILKMYIELESLRFDQSFQYEISVDEGLDNEQVLVPSLMVQPFAENAIWHGLMHKDGGKILQIRFENQSEDFLSCTIRDNGVGREKASAINRSKISTKMHESRGIAIVRERLQLLEKKTGKPAALTIHDVSDDKGQVAGTEVQIIIPFYNPEET